MSRALFGPVALCLLLFAVPAAGQAPVLPAPTHASTLYLLFYGENVVLGGAAFSSEAAAIEASVAQGPYLKAGFAGYFGVDLPWDADLSNPVLSIPSDFDLGPALARCASRGLSLHAAVDLGISRATWTYDPAKAEDRRNAQWYADGSLASPAQLAEPQGFTERVYLTPSRNARKLRRHLEAKVRALAETNVRASSGGRSVTRTPSTPASRARDAISASPIARIGFR